MKAVIFDMDGVIVDSEPIHEKAWINFFSERGIHLTDEDKKRIKGRRGTAIVKMFIPQVSEEEAQEMRNKKNQIVLEEMRKEVEVVNGFESFFKEAKQVGLLVGVATSAEFDRASIVLDRVGILSEVDVLVTAKDVVRGKSHPETFLTTAKKLDVLPKECYVFEDSKSGIISAKEAGTTPVLIMTTFNSDEIEGWKYAYKDFSEINLSEHLVS